MFESLFCYRLDVEVLVLQNWYVCAGFLALEVGLEAQLVKFAGDQAFNDEDEVEMSLVVAITDK